MDSISLENIIKNYQSDIARRNFKAALWAIKTHYGRDATKYADYQFCSTTIEATIASIDTQTYGIWPSDVKKVFDEDVWYYLTFDFSAVFESRTDGIYWYQNEVKPKNAINVDDAYQMILSRLNVVDPSTFNSI